MKKIAQESGWGVYQHRVPLRKRGMGHPFSWKVWYLRVPLRTTLALLIYIQPYVWRGRWFPLTLQSRWERRSLRLP